MQFAKKALFLASAVGCWTSLGYTDEVNSRLIPLVNGEVATTPDGGLISNFGTPFVQLGGTTLRRIANPVRSGSGAFEATVDTRGTGFTGFGVSSHGFYHGGAAYFQTRDYSNLESITFFWDNQTGVPCRIKLQLRDHRDSGAHQLQQWVTVSSQPGYRQYAVTIGKMQRIGSPDLKKTRNLFFVIEPTQGPVVGAIRFDDIVAKERGSKVSPASASAAVLDEVEFRRVALQLINGLDQETFFAYLNTSFSDVIALNSTAMTLAILPVAVQRGYITRKQMESIVSRVCTTLSRISWSYVPPRYLESRTLVPHFTIEESPLDAAIMALSLLKAKAFIGSRNAGVTAQIDAQLARFNFGAFFVPGQGFRLAYLPGTQAFHTGIYRDMSTEIYVLALAAHLVGSVRVPIEQSWNTGVNRVKLGTGTGAYIVSSHPEYRSPFMLWLAPALVDFTDRGLDNYPVADLRSNPALNAVAYQKAVVSLLGSRPLQPDAGIDLTGQYWAASAWHGPTNLTHPWSGAGFVGLADAAAGLRAKRDPLIADDHSLIGYPECSVNGVTVGRYDLFNVGLYALATSSKSPGGNRVLAADPAVKAALDRVFPTRSVAAIARDSVLDPTGAVNNGVTFVERYVDIAASDLQVELVTEAVSSE